MVDCLEVDPKNTNHYGSTATRAIIEVAVRQEDFIRRHGLAQQFTAEDEARKR
jgi:hypothetical protein